MNEPKITVKRTQIVWQLAVPLFVLLASFQKLAAATDNSFGFLFDRFQLTLEQGYRTEAAGPFFYSAQTETADTLAFPPFFSCFRDDSVAAQEDDFLYPLLTSTHYGKERRWQFLQLISFAGGQEPDDAVESRFTLFPFYFQQRSTDTNQNYTAVAPFYGHLKHRLFHDEIFFVLFPFYSQTKKRDIVTDNYLYPIGHIRNGDGLHGWQIWPLVGSEHKTLTTVTNGFGDVSTVGGHDYFFCLWPLYIRQDNDIGADITEQYRPAFAGNNTTLLRKKEQEAPEKFRASIPLFVYSRSPQVDLTTVIWPLFTWIDNREKKYREWQMPWPIIVFARGEGKTTSRVFPLFSVSHNDIKESDSYLWPVYTYRRTHSDPLDLQRKRVLFFLYSDMVEKNTRTGDYKRRLDMWPFFTWHRDFNGNERLQVLAPLEPAVPDNRGIERNWSPLWSLWRAENNPQTGAASHSLLWNLYRDEAAPARKKVSLLFGLFQYQYDGETKRTKLFYVTVAKRSATAK
jgi:hypothetical protein